MKIPVGKKHIEIAQSFISSAATFGAAGGLTLLYFTDFKTLLQYVPIYGSKYKKDD